MKPIKYSVPTDVFMDIALILVESEIQHRIISTNQERNEIMLRLEISPEHEEANENIESIIEDYNYYRYGGEE